MLVWDLPDGFYLVRNGEIYRATNWTPPKDSKTMIIPPIGFIDDSKDDDDG